MIMAGGRYSNTLNMGVKKKYGSIPFVSSRKKSSSINQVGTIIYCANNLLCQPMEKDNKKSI